MRRQEATTPPAFTFRTGGLAALLLRLGTDDPAAGLCGRYDKHPMELDVATHAVTNG